MNRIGTREDGDGVTLIFSFNGATCEALLICRRPGGVLLGIPPGFLPAAKLIAGQEGGPRAFVGPSVLLPVPAAPAEG